MTDFLRVNEDALTRSERETPYKHELAFMVGRLSVELESLARYVESGQTEEAERLVQKLRDSNVLVPKSELEE